MTSFVKFSVQSIVLGPGVSANACVHATDVFIVTQNQQLILIDIYINSNSIKIIIIQHDGSKLTCTQFEVMLFQNSNGWHWET
jgi:hypothetical protein